MSEPIPAEIIAEFKSVALERLAGIESAWHEVIFRPDGKLGVSLEREVHNLKGDARLIGFHDVAVLCHKLEDLLRFARTWGYVVPESIDLLVATVIGVIRLLIKKRIGRHMAGLDLAEFSRQIDDTLREAYMQSAPGPGQALGPPAAEDKDSALSHDSTRVTGRVSLTSLSRLAAAVGDVYLQHLIARGQQRTDLRSAWLKLVNEIRLMRSVPLDVILSSHATAARDLGQRLHKKIDFELNTNGLFIGPTVAPVIKMAVTHAVTNAIDHGIESPEQRREAGKDEAGKVRVTGAMQGERVELVIADDGRGVDLDLVRQRAIECGLLRADQRGQVSDGDLLEMLSHPSFTTREWASETSGRGVGLDAVRTALKRHDGRLRLDSQKGKGTRVILQLPQQRRELSVHCFGVPGVDIRLAVPSAWKTSVTQEANGAIDPLAALGLPPRETSDTDPHGVTLLKLCNGEQEVILRVAGKVSTTVAERICPVDEAIARFEVILLKDGEALLVHPDKLDGAAG